MKKYIIGVLVVSLFVFSSLLITKKITFLASADLNTQNILSAAYQAGQVCPLGHTKRNTVRNFHPLTGEWTTQVYFEYSDSTVCWEFWSSNKFLGLGKELVNSGFTKIIKPDGTYEYAPEIE